MSKALLQALNEEVIEDPGPDDIERFERIFVLDTSTPTQLGALAEHLKGPIIIDHHLRNTSWDGLAEIYYCDDTKTSCAEIIYQILKASAKPIERVTGIALMAGIITDTGRFKFAKPETFKTFMDIMSESGVQPDEVLQIVETDNNYDRSQRIAHLKAAQRLKYEMIADKIVVTSIVGAFESSACKYLLMLGADIAFVASQKGNELRISAKAKQALVKQGLHLGKFLNEVGLECDCDGGGHPGVGGLNGVGDPEAILKICTEKLRDWLLQ
jgi:nanoRNase/pAp phosphatase (c-di-AMP/oligoRNAs hydrolase)